MEFVITMQPVRAEETDAAARAAVMAAGDTAGMSTKMKAGTISHAKGEQDRRFFFAPVLFSSY